MKKGLIIFLIGLGAALLVSVLMFGKVTLLSFINISFIIGGTLLFISLFVMVAQGGFFDGITYGFRRTFQSGNKTLSKQEAEEMRSFSEVISFSYVPVMVAGVSLTAVMLLCLGIYYV